MRCRSSSPCRRPRPPRSPGLFFKHQEGRRFGQGLVFAGQFALQLPHPEDFRGGLLRASRRALKTGQHLLAPLVQLGLVQSLAAQKLAQLRRGDRGRGDHGLQFLFRCPILGALRRHGSPGGVGGHAWIVLRKATRLTQPARQGALRHTYLLGQLGGTGSIPIGQLADHSLFKSLCIWHWVTLSRPHLSSLNTGPGGRANGSPCGSLRSPQGEPRQPQPPLQATTNLTQGAFHSVATRKGTASRPCPTLRN